MERNLKRQRRLFKNSSHYRQNSNGKGKSDRGLFILTVVLTLLGIATIADVSAPLALSVFGNSFFFVKQQAISAAIGFAGLLVLSNIHYSFWKKLAPVAFVVSIVLLILVLLPSFGSRLLGAKRWISIGSFNFQPSEFVKVSLALFFAYLYEKKAPYWYYLVALGGLIGLVMLQPDLGTTLVITTIAVVQIFMTGFPLLYMGGLLVGGGVLGTLLILISSYRRQRLFTFFNSMIDPIGKTAEDAGGSAYHIRQILIAIGSGGFFGVGLGQSRQKYLFLPETPTDSIFAIIAEEIGFFGCIILISIFIYFVFKLVKLASRAPDEFSTLFIIGVAAWIAGQMFFNIGSMIALVPLTGIPLPFISYGGTSLIAILGAMGIVLNISKYAKK